MTTPGVTGRALSRILPDGISIAPATVRLLGILVVLLVACVVVSRFSTAVFIAIGIALLGVLATISWRSPRLVLIGMALMPIFDRYFISLLVPRSLADITNFFSEGLLLLVALVISARAWRDGTLVAALRHPAFPLLIGFVVVGLVSLVVNGVPPVVGLAGIIFTVDAVALFFLPRMVGFPPRHAAIAAGAFVVIAGAAAVLAIAQITLAPTILGMEVSQGRFSEGHRVTAFFDGNPNMLGAVLAMGVPFPAFAARYLHGKWRIAAWILVVVMALALFTPSRAAPGWAWR